jgi:hypothetical protein
MKALTIYVPAPDSTVARVIRPCSAIVGENLGSDQVMCYFEGGLAGLDACYASRLKHAAGRLVTQYPTIARAIFDRRELVEVGTMDGERYTVTEVTDEDRLTAWAQEGIAGIVGERLPEGSVRWAAAAELCNSASARPIGHKRTPQELWYKTQAGQIISFNLTNNAARVWSYDEPHLARKFTEIGLPVQELVHAFGSAAAAEATFTVLAQSDGKATADDADDYPSDLEWTHAMMMAASQEGWNLFDCNGSSNGRTQLCRDDDMALLADDDAAWKHVIGRAEFGSVLHLEALRLIASYNPIEACAIFKSLSVS